MQGSLFRAQEILNAFKAYAPETLNLVLKALNHSSPDLGFLRPMKSLGQCLKISVSTTPSWKKLRI